MTNDLQHSLVSALLLWSLASLGTSVTGLYAGANDFWRSFWLMSGLWGLIDGLIAWYVLVDGQRTPAQLLPILRFNAGLDVLYVLWRAIAHPREAPPSWLRAGRARAGGVPSAVRQLLLVAVRPDYRMIE